MASQAGGPSDAAFRLLGRVWSRLVWSVLFLTAVLWDVFSLEFPGSVDAPHAFAAGMATGMTFAGLVYAVARARSAQEP